MPTTYAHYKFGMEVLDKLDGNLKKIIENNIELYNIGLHGPDILFYYHPLKSNDISAMGHTIHSKIANDFFENARRVILRSKDYDASLSYIAGFICHYMLDSQCHPYIRQNEDKFSHNEIEAELDRAVMLNNNLNPLSHKRTFHLNSNEKNAQCISEFLDKVTGDDVLKVLKSMKFYLNLLVAPGKIKRSILIGALKISGNYDSMIGLILKHEPEKDFEKINENLLCLYKKAIEPTASLIEEYCNNLKNTEKINQRFNRNFE